MVVSDNPVYQEEYYRGGDEVCLLFADGSTCATPELVFVPAVTDWFDDTAGEDSADFAPELFEYYPLD